MPKEPTFAVKFRCDNEWGIYRYLHGWVELLHYNPDVACWFKRHPKATHLQSDHDGSITWRYEILKEG